MKSVNIATFNLLHKNERIKERIDKLLYEAVNKEIDILCLQEVTDEAYQYLVKQGKELGYKGYASAGTISVNEQAILTKLPCSSVWENPLGHVSFKYLRGKTAVFDDYLLAVELEDFVIISAHAPWGTNEGLRLQFSKLITDFVAKNYNDTIHDKPVLLGGDLNATPEADSIRYLSGLSAECRFMWSSIWDVIDIFPTARVNGGWAEDTAKSVGILYPAHLPANRTIDYLFGFGFTFGRKGGFIKGNRFGASTLSDGRGISDHYGIWGQVIQG